jgi:hypothetical protein
MTDLIKPALGAFMSQLGVKGSTKSSDTYECDPQFGDYECREMPTNVTLTKKPTSKLKISELKHRDWKESKLMQIEQL